MWCVGTRWNACYTRLCVLVACATVAQLQAASAGPYIWCRLPYHSDTLSSKKESNQLYSYSAYPHTTAPYLTHGSHHQKDLSFSAVVGYLWTLLSQCLSQSSSCQGSCTCQGSSCRGSSCRGSSCRAPPVDKSNRRSLDRRSLDRRSQPPL